jgi:protein involved in polysaccharide export with SLBB domain
MGPEGDPRLRDGRLAETARRLRPVPMACPTLLDHIPGLLPLAVAHSVVLWDGVARPGLYPAASAAALEDLMALGGGGAAGAARVLERPGAVLARPGETVAASSAQVALAGPVSLPGWRDLATAPSLRRLLGDGEVLGDDVYPLFGLILRRAEDGVGARVVPFSPAAILSGQTEVRLRDGDRVRLLASADIRSLLGDGEGDDEAETAAIGELGDGHLAALLADHAVSVTGAVARPGRYPVAGTATLARLLEAAGGLTRRGDRSAVEIIQEDSVDSPTAESVPVAARFTVDLTWQDPVTLVLRPGNLVRVPARFDPVIPAAITIEGEVMHPGTYPLVRGERLSDLIARAGGLTRDAYPDGAIFTREVERQRRTEEFRRQADEIERRLATRLLEEDPPAPAQVDRVRDLIAELRGLEPPGRVVVEADPEMLALHPERDPLLAAGDALFIPARSLSVRVTGEVLSPAALPFRSGMDADDYIRAAGGFTRFADRDRVFLLYADGSAQPVAESLWRFTPVPVPPGATIVVPRDPEPFDFLAFTESIASVLGQIALTAASITVIGN